MEPSRPSDLLQEHAAAFERLAHRLVLDAHRAEDVMQEARLAAWRGPDRQVRSVPGWLTGCLRHLAGNTLRSEARRRVREERAARGEVHEPSDPGEMLARLEQQRVLAGYLEELDEPYRHTLFLRFYENLSPRAIAGRQGVPVETVKTRLQRGLARLRARLDAASGGDRSAWCALLWPTLGSSGGSSAGPTLVGATLGGVLVNMKIVAALVLLSLAVGLWQLQRGHGQPLDPSSRGALAPVVSLAPEKEIPREATVGMPGSDRIVAGVEALTELTPTLPPGWTFRGTVRDQDAPVGSAHVRIELRPTERPLEGRTNASGEYEIFAPFPAELSPHASLAPWVVVQAAGYGEESASPDLPIDEGAAVVQDFVLVRQAHALGRVTSQKGGLLSGVIVSAVDGGGSVVSTCRSRDDGAFALPWSAPAAWIVAGSSEVGMAIAGAFPETTTDFDTGNLVLRETASLSGVVRFPDGAPVAGTQVRVEQVCEEESASFGEAWLRSPGGDPWPSFRTAAGMAGGSVRTDGEGRFALSGLEPGQYRLEFPELGPYREAPSAGPFPTGVPVDVVVDAYTVHVTTVDTAGLPVPGARLWIEGDEFATVAGSRGLEARHSFAAAPGDWKITASLGAARPMSESLTVLEGTYQYHLELVLDFDPVTGTLVVFVRDEEGLRLPEFRVELFGSDSLVSDLSDLRPDDDGVLLSIPTGEYQVRAHFPLWGHARGVWPYHFQAQGHAVIRRDEVTTLELTTRAGGRLDFRFATIPSVGSTPIELELVGVGESRSLHGLTQLRDDGSMSVGYPNAPRGGTTELIDPGSYELRAVAEGFHPIALPVEVLRGATVPVELTLEPVAR